MNKVNLKHLVKMKSLLLTVLVLFSLFISGNVIAQKFHIEDYVKVKWDPKNKDVVITATVYVFSFGPTQQPAYLEQCIFEYITDRDNCIPFMEIKTPVQEISKNTSVNLVKYLDKYEIKVLNVNPPINMNNCARNIIFEVANHKKFAELKCAWHLDNNFDNIHSIRINGIWSIDNPFNQKQTFFRNVNYDLHRSGPSALKSNTPDINTKVTKNDLVKVFKDSEAIVIKGADPKANIKVYTTTGAEIKSVVSTDDVVKINLPAKQFYIVHVGDSQYKVAL